MQVMYDGFGSEGGGESPPYNSLCKEVPPERSTFFKLQVCEREGIFNQLKYMKRKGNLLFQSLKRPKRAKRCILRLSKCSKTTNPYGLTKDNVILTQLVLRLLTVSSQMSLPTKLTKFKKVVLKTLEYPSPPKTELTELVERFISCLFSLICQLI